MTEAQLKIAQEHYETNFLIFLKPEKLSCSGFQIQALRRAERGNNERQSHTSKLLLQAPLPSPPEASLTPLSKQA